jgi:hypothetical protein
VREREQTKDRGIERWDREERRKEEREEREEERESLNVCTCWVSSLGMLGERSE